MKDFLQSIQVDEITGNVYVGLQNILGNTVIYRINSSNLTVEDYQLLPDYGIPLSIYVDYNNPSFLPFFINGVVQTNFSNSNLPFTINGISNVVPLSAIDFRNSNIQESESSDIEIPEVSMGVNDVLVWSKDGITTAKEGSIKGLSYELSNPPKTTIKLPEFTWSQKTVVSECFFTTGDDAGLCRTFFIRDGRLFAQAAISTGSPVTSVGILGNSIALTNTQSLQFVNRTSLVVSSSLPLNYNASSMAFINRDVWLGTIGDGLLVNAHTVFPSSSSSSSELRTTSSSSSSSSSSELRTTSSSSSNSSSTKFRTTSSSSSTKLKTTSSSSSSSSLSSGHHGIGSLRIGVNFRIA